MVFVDWQSIKNPQMLIELLEKFLLRVFGEEFLREEVKKLEQYVSKSRLENFEYLRPLGVHRAAQWYKLVENLENRGYTFDLRFSAEIEEFMNLTIFALSLDSLMQRNVLSLENPIVRGALHDKNRFESLLYEVLISANYALNGFEVRMLDLFNEGRTDIFARKDATKVYCECKKLKRKEFYVDIAIKVLSEISQRKISAIIDIELFRKPKSVDDIVKIIEKAIDEGKATKSEEAYVQITLLPELIEGIFTVSIPKPENIEYAVAAAYAGIFNGVLKVKEPKIIVIRNANKSKDVEKQLMNRLREALEQLNTVSNGRKVIYVDITEVAGRPILQLPELIKLSPGPEILASYLEKKVREWLINHPDIDSVVLTQSKLYTDEFGNPFVLVVENHVIAAYIAPGWTMITRIVPMPQGATPEILTNLALELSKRGNYPLAILYLEKAIELNPNLKEAYNNLGKILNDLGRPDEALKYLNKALEIDPKYTSALVNRGIALALLGRYSEALEDLNKAVTLDPNNEKTWYNKALVHYILGQHNEAYKCVLRTLHINPNYEHAKKLKEQLDRILKQKS
jgi:tetratricopeptide (TPR) repeat protein